MAKPQIVCALFFLSVFCVGCNKLVKTPQDASLTVGVIVALVTIAGWFVNDILQKKKEEKRRKIDEKIKFLERQIEQFYGPLYNLVNQIVICNHVFHQINVGTNRSLDDKEKIWKFFQKNYFIPLHDEFNGVLKTKLYLIEGSLLPTTFYDYLRHAVQEQVQFIMWDEHKIDTSDIQGTPYPNRLYFDIEQGLENTMMAYHELTMLIDKSSTIKKNHINHFTKEEA